METLEDLFCKEDKLEITSKALKAVSHPLRLKILCALKENEKTVIEIVEQVGSSQSNVSQHLDILRSREIILSRRSGNKVLCRIKDDRILTIIANAKDLFCDD